MKPRSENSIQCGQCGAYIQEKSFNNHLKSCNPNQLSAPKPKPYSNFSKSPSSKQTKSLKNPLVQSMDTLKKSSFIRPKSVMCHIW